MGRGAPPDTQVSQWIHIAIGLSSLVLILVITLYPYSFSWEKVPARMGCCFPFLGRGKSDNLDVYVNTLLFLPLGFSLASSFAAKDRGVGVRALALVLVLVGGLSYVLEVAQFFLPRRFPSLFDVIANSAGGALGVLAFHLWRIQNIRLSLAVYILLAFLGSILLQRSTTLRIWNSDFPLVIGNEQTRNRPWRGYISQLYIADRALSEQKVPLLRSEWDLTSILNDSLIASYRFSSVAEKYRDDTGRLPALKWKSTAVNFQQPGTAFLHPDHWLQSEGHASLLAERIKKTSQFTLGVIIATDDLAQTGPARIVSFAGGVIVRNFTLGQQQRDLIFRLRTPITSGSTVELKAPDVFSSKTPQHIVVTYDGSRLFLYVNGKRRSEALDLSPGAALCSLFFSSQIMASKVCKWSYYGSIFIPVGLLLSLNICFSRKQFAKSIIVSGGGVVVSAVILESLLASVSGRPMVVENLLLSSMLMIGTLVVSLLYRVGVERRRVVAGSYPVQSSVEN
jgi:glycopeptide antibiotics resistance protein